ncbi:MAG TPA: 50S ribosomal protein L17 [bacterium]|jgi:large subunit ribosomal protein L17|nr:50S ribosomal protein L17 [bacterium]HOG38016.1 50S ribosomal protein L17 [bacterium]
MRHQNKNKILDRKKGPRTALIKNLAGQVILFEKVKTTSAKAKVIKPYVEKLITKSAKNDVATRRYLITKLNSVKAVKKLLEIWGPKFKETKGGYLKITKSGERKGDGAEMVYITFTK